MSATIAELVFHLDRAIPFAWAEPWDRVGLLVGDPVRPLTRVYVTLDATASALRRARDAGASVLLSHHPAFLEPFDRLTWRGRGADVALDALEAGVALVACHTNLDRAPEGADALAVALGFEMVGPLERGYQEIAQICVYAPSEATERIRAAMTVAGAGRVGEYDGCAFVNTGRGYFTPRDGSSPVVGASGRESLADESRLEMVCPPDVEEAVIAAARAAHPYEEPLIVSSRAGLSRGAIRTGRLCLPPASMPLGGLAALVGERLGVRCTVWGDRERPVRSVALAQGSGRSLVADALAAGADTFVTGELRYHEALDAVHAGLAVIEAGHDATEWPLTAVLSRIAGRMGGLAGDAVVLDEEARHWWTT